jgi:hypothetical protein
MFERVNKKKTAWQSKSPGADGVRRFFDALFAHCARTLKLCDELEAFLIYSVCRFLCFNCDKKVTHRKRHYRRWLSALRHGILVQRERIGKCCFNNRPAEDQHCISQARALSALCCALMMMRERGTPPSAMVCALQLSRA